MKTCKCGADCSTERTTRCLECSRAHNWNRKYGLSREDYEAMMEDQCGACAICFTSSNALVVDHDHDTEVVRGLLCHHCNTALGLARDSIHILANAIIYLERN